MRVRATAAAVLVAALAGAAAAATIEFRISLPAGTPDDATIYVAGDHPALGAWRPDGLLCERPVPGLARAVVEVEEGAILEWKATRGSWATVEKAADGSEVANRRHDVAGDAVIEAAVEAWADSAPSRPSTLTGDVRFHEGFRSAVLGNERMLRVYLPPGYAETDARCPVLYMHDGQNLFDAATSFVGVEWGVDEVCERLIRAGRIPPLIVVGIDNAGDARLDEYTPVAETGVSPPRGGRAADYARFLVEEVKPFIDRTYRTRPERAQTAVGGSSLGGILSLHLAWTRPDVFSAALVVSPSLWWGEGDAVRRIEATSAAPDPAPRLWIDMGTAEGDEAETAVARLRLLGAALAAKGLREGDDFTIRIYEGAEHSERAWAARLEEILLFLYGSRRLRPGAR